jgi:hypothetical protein
VSDLRYRQARHEPARRPDPGDADLISEDDLGDELSVVWRSPGVLTADSEHQLTGWTRDRLATTVWPPNKPTN